jgi:hypothetical protein
MRKALASLAPLLPFFALACKTPTLEVSDSDQLRAQRDLSGQQRFLRVAAFVGPLWNDGEKAFLTDRPAGEIDLVEDLGGKPIPPPAFERVLPPGTRLRIRDVEFPTAFTVAQRVLVTPRYHTWVYLQVQGETRPCVIVLPQDLKSSDDIRIELERYLAQDDPGPALAALPAETRELVLHKEAAPGMSARALEMSWGLPERKHIDRPSASEEWFWAGGKRHAWLKDDRVEKVER